MTTSGKHRGESTGSRSKAQLRDATRAHGDWRDALRRNERNQLYAAPANAITILQHDEMWEGVLAWDEFRNGITFVRAAPWYADDGAPSPAGSLWTEDDDARLQAWLLRRWSFNLGRPDCYTAARIVARERKVHPVREWLQGLEWDGVPRVDAWLSTYLGVAPTEYSKLVGRWWLISAVARVIQPGCEVHHALVLEGPQGIAKSTAIRVLATPQWFSGGELEWHSKDKYLLIRGRWIFELAELAGLGKADLDRVKAFMTQAVDDYRGPYEKHTSSVARHTVFAGTVNPLPDGTYPAFSDPTGNRRWWPVRCGSIDIAALTRDQPQLFAESFLRYQDSDIDVRRWWPATAAERALCAGEQEQRAPEDVWQGQIDAWLRERLPSSRVTVSQVLSEAVEKPLKDCTGGDKIRAGLCIARAGWVYVGRHRVDGVRERVYERASTAVPSSTGDSAESNMGQQESLEIPYA